MGTLHTAEASDYNLSYSVEAISTDFHVSDTSPILDTSLVYEVRFFWLDLEGLGTFAYCAASWWFSRTGPADDYYSFKFFMKGDWDVCTRVTVWIGWFCFGWAEDSDGRSYSVGVAIE